MQYRKFKDSLHSPFFPLGTSAPNISEESTNGAQPLDCIGGFVAWRVPTYPTLAMKLKMKIDNINNTYIKTWSTQTSRPSPYLFSVWNAGNLG